MEATIALLAFRLLDGPTASHLGEAWPPAALASLMGSVFVSAAVTTVIFLSSGTYSARLHAHFLEAAVFNSVTGCAAALLAFGALRWDHAEVYPLLILTGALFAAYRGYTRLHKRHGNLELLYDFTRRLTTAAAREDVLVELLQQVRTLLRAEVAEITMLGGTAPMRCRLTGSDPAIRENYVPVTADWPLSQVLSDDRGLVVPARTRVSALRGYLSHRGFRDCLIVPLHGMSGVLIVADRLGEVATFTGEDGKLLQTVANQAVAALENGRLLERLSHDSRHDALTGLANRTNFHEALQRAHEDDTRFAVLLMDLDRFKEVNDTLGHHHGDLLLQHVATRLSAAAHPADVVARLGGDELRFSCTGQVPNPPASAPTRYIEHSPHQ